MARSTSWSRRTRRAPTRSRTGFLPQPASLSSCCVCTGRTKPRPRFSTARGRSRRSRRHDRQFFALSLLLADCVAKVASTKMPRLVEAGAGACRYARSAKPRRNWFASGHVQWKLPWPASDQGKVWNASGSKDDPRGAWSLANRHLCRERSDA